MVSNWQPHVLDELIVGAASGMVLTPDNCSPAPDAGRVKQFVNSNPALSLQFFHIVE